MIPLSLEEVGALAPGRLEPAPGAERVTGVEIDSRRTGPGDLFVAVGRGAEFLGDARERGAAATLVPDDAFAALAALGGAVRRRSSARVVGVTGSTGKTTTKDILYALCRPHARTVAAEGSQNNEIGLPLTLCRLEEDTEVAILELGMRGLGQIAELCGMARPDVGVITCIAPVHLELLGTIERVAQAKAEVVQALPPGGAAVVPAGERRLEPYLARDDLRLFRFGPGGDVSLVSFTPEHDGSLVEVEAFGRRLTLEFSFTARYNARNALAAVAAYHALGLPLEGVQAGAREVRLSRWRGEEAPLPGGGLLINDSYNANPVSVTAALEHLVERAAGRRTVAVLGDMAELGPGAPAYHRDVGATAAGLGLHALVAVGPLARGYLEGAQEVPDKRWAPDAEHAATAARALVRPGDCVLVKGSRAVGLEAVAEALALVAA